MVYAFGHIKAHIGTMCAKTRGGRERERDKERERGREGAGERVSEKDRVSKIQRVQEGHENV